MVGHRQSKQRIIDGEGFSWANDFERPWNKVLTWVLLAYYYYVEVLCKGPDGFLLRAFLLFSLSLMKVISCLLRVGLEVPSCILVMGT